MSEIAVASTSLPAGKTAGLGPKFITLYILICITIGTCFIVPPPATIQESGVNMEWPAQVLGYAGKDAPVSKPELDLLPPDTEFAKKIYTNAGGDHIQAQIVLSGIEHRSIHRPEKCLEGQGWTVNSSQVVKVPLASGRSIDAMVLDISRPWRTPDGSTIILRSLYTYFFVSKDRETPYHLNRLAITNLDLLLHNKAHRWAYVIVMADVTKGLFPNGRDREQTLDLIERFIREAAPDFLKSEMPAGLAAKR